MARFSGKKYPGATRDLREIRRQEADARGTKTKPKRRRSWRLTKQAKAADR